jgi:hypothetical protein
MRYARAQHSTQCDASLMSEKETSSNDSLIHHHHLMKVVPKKLCYGLDAKTESKVAKSSLNVLQGTRYFDP